MNKYRRILELIQEWFGDNFEDGELDALIFEIIEIVEDKE